MAELQGILGNNLRRYRELRGWSQAELAAKADLSQNYVGYIERGERWPSAEILTGLASALDVPPSQLLSAPEELPVDQSKEIAIALLDRVRNAMEKASADLGLDRP
jgi:transcriptional regulator with XRE-family HTH domain